MPARATLPAPPGRPNHAALQSAYLILKYAHDTAESLLSAFDRARSAKRGAPTDEEQDLLRAMVVLAGAGLDSMVKQVVRDALPQILQGSPDSAREMAPLVARHLRRRSADADGDDDSDTASRPISAERLAQVILAESPRIGVAELLVRDLTAGSLQSASELSRVLAYLGTSLTSLGTRQDALREVFECRNRIIHEMDIDFSQPNRNRRPRRRTAMVRHASALLKLGATILAHADSKLLKASPSAAGRT